MLVKGKEYNENDIINGLKIISIYKKPVGKKNKLYTFVEVECHCSNKTRFHTGIYHIIDGHTTSCSCVFSENSRKRISKRNYNHGYGKTVELATWTNIKKRCYDIKNSHYTAYGGRGIRVCNRWLTFNNFIEDMGRRPADKSSIDRLDENADYSKENCRWANDMEQKESKENNRQIVAFGEVKSVLHWTKDIRCKASINTIKYRLWVLGWNTEKSIETVEYLG